MHGGTATELKATAVASAARRVRRRAAGILLATKDLDGTVSFRSDDD